MAEDERPSLTATTCHYQLYILQKRLKEEYLFVRQEKDILHSLNENVAATSKKLFHAAWVTRQHWRNLERLVSGCRVFPAECSNTAKCIECAKFEDASKHLGYQEMKYGEFLMKLREKPRLVALILNSADNIGIDNSQLVRLLLCSIFGSCIFKEDEKLVLKILKSLTEIQVVQHEDPIKYFCSPKGSVNAFSTVLRLYSELLFSAKLYLTAALHGVVMQVIVDDSFYLDLEMNKILSRFPPKVMREKFGEPGTPKAAMKIEEHMEDLQKSLINLCRKFLKSLMDKIYCFPPNLQWILGQLYTGLKKSGGLEEQKIKGLLGHILINFFICPAIINPEPYGINSDATISETARYNLAQIASILRSLALAGCGMKDPKIGRLAEAIDVNSVLLYVDGILDGVSNVHPLSEVEPVQGLKRTSVLMTEKELKAMIYLLKRIQRENNKDLNEEGLEDLMETLPPLPRRWTKPRLPSRNATSLPPSMNFQINLTPPPIPPSRRGGHKGKKTSSMYGTGKEQEVVIGTAKEPIKEPDSIISSLKNEIDQLLKDMSSMVEIEEDVLVITFGNDIAEEAGMLSEEKVLGLCNVPPSSSTFDLETSDEQRRKRTSFIMIDSLKDLEGLLVGETIEENQQEQEDDQISGDSDLLDSSGYLIVDNGSQCSTPETYNFPLNVDPNTELETITNKPEAGNSTNPFLVTNSNLFNPFTATDQNHLDSSPHLTPSEGSIIDDMFKLDDMSKLNFNIVSTPETKQKNNVQSLPSVANSDNLLIDFDFGDSSDTSNPMSPSNPFADTSNPFSPSNPFDSINYGQSNIPTAVAEKTTSLDRGYFKQPEKQDFFRQPPDKTTSLHRENLQRNELEYKTNQISSSSLVSGLNAILQSSSAPSPNSLDKIFGFEDLQEEKTEETNVGVGTCDDDVRRSESASSGSSDSTKEANEEHDRLDAERFVDSGFYADSELGSPPEQKFHSDSIVAMYKKQERRSLKKQHKITADSKNEASQVHKQSKQPERTYMDIEAEKRGRIKSSGAWLKGKLVTGKNRMVTGLRQNRTKSDGHQLKKGDGGKVYRNLSDLESPTESQPKSLEKEEPDASAVISGRTAKDVSEDILQKYRKIASSPASLMGEIQHENLRSPEANIAGTVQFGETYKFEDAKKKLRIVLCLADRTNFPKGTTTCFHLLVTFLQAQLAEAINLQDRSFVAQLHETLRSIRQIPEHSCESLLTDVEEDYKQRSPFVTYLIRSKQGLLATLSHLEQLLKKVERDKNICSKYFTTVCVRLFLETPEKKREIGVFAQIFENTRMVDEKCALLEEFLDTIYDQMSKEPAWITATNEQWMDATMATERAIVSRIYKAAFYPNGSQDVENDRVLHDHICRLTPFVTENHKALQIRKVFQKEAPWPSAQTELLMINAYKTPADKLRCIHRCCITIMNLLSMATQNENPGADDFVPVLVFVVIRANPPNLITTKQFVNNFYERRLSGEQQYCWMQFCAAVEFIKSIQEE